MSINSQECERLQQFQIEQEDKDYNFDSPSKASANTTASESKITFTELKKFNEQDMHANNHLFQSQLEFKQCINPQNALNHWKKGEFCMSAGRLEEAISELKKCIEVNPFLTKAEFIGLGCNEDRIGYHYDSEYSWIKKSKQKSLREISPHDMLSVCLSKSNHYHQDKQWYERMIAETNDYRLVYGLANFEYNHKNFAEAQLQYLRCLELEPRFDQTYQKIANIYCFKLNKDEEATVWAQRALELNPDNIYANLIRALCIQSVEDRIQALKDVLHIIQDYARPFNGLGNAYYNNKNFDDAIKMYKRSIEISPMYEHPYYGLGSIYNQLSNFDESIVWYKKCIEINPLYDYPLYGLGIAYNNKNDTKNAILWLQKCIEANPKYDCPYYALGNIYRSSKKYDLALKFYKKSLECKQIDPLCFVNIALSYIGMRDYQSAYDHMKMAKDNLNQVSGLSKGNIEYVKDHIEKYLNDDKFIEKNQKGILSFRQILHISKNTVVFAAKFQQLYRSGQ